MGAWRSQFPMSSHLPNNEKLYTGKVEGSFNGSILKCLRTESLESNYLSSYSQFTIPLLDGNLDGYFRFPNTYEGLCSRLTSKESTCQCKKHRFNPWDGKIPWRKKW